MDNKTRKKIEFNFYNYEKNKAESAEYISELCSLKSPVLENLGRGSGIGNPTEKLGINLAIYQKYLWCEVVERTCNTFYFDFEFKIIKLKYFDKKSEWDILNSCWISRRTFYYWTEKVLSLAEQWAREFHLF